ncbi:MAG: PorV/PorQ family protein [Elusimicrobiales bacterium]
MRKLSIALMVASALSQAAHAGTAGSAFLKIAPGAREQGMAGAATAVAGGATAMYINPAGMAGTGAELSASHVELAQENKLENIVLAHDAFGGRLAYGLTYVHYGDLEGRDTSGNLTSNFTAYDGALQLAYAKAFGNLSLGAAVKAVRNKIEDESGTGAGLDAGAIYDFKAFKLGAAITNIGKSGKLGGMDEDLPTTAAIGASTLIKSVLIAADCKRNIPENRTIIAAGAEAALIAAFTLRAGYQKDATNTNIPSDNMNGLNAGFGLAIGKLTVDYAYSSQGELGNNHRFTLTAKF